MPKSATAKEKTNKLAERECNWRFLATRKITKPFPAAVTIETSQPNALNQFSIAFVNSKLLVEQS